MLREGLQDLEEFFILPEGTASSKPSWFGFPLSVRTESPFDRERVIAYLEDHKISTRLVFAGNLTRQPAYRQVEYRKISDLKVSDFIMDQSFWMGLYPGLAADHIAYMLEILHEAVRDFKKLVSPVLVFLKDSQDD
jgi:CDP-6-deoxy-D-xylo-4-hexulose-3-dehydrase